MPRTKKKVIPEVSPKVRDVVEKKMMGLTKQQEVALFKDLTHMTSLEAAKKYGIDKHYERKGSQRLAVHNVVKRVRKSPELYGISQEAVDLVLQELEARKELLAGDSKQTMALVAKERDEFKDNLQDIRDNAAKLLKIKLKRLSKDKKALDQANIKSISDVLSMAIDKDRLINNESTENVFRFNKTDFSDVNPQEALKLVLAAREEYMKLTDKN